MKGTGKERRTLTGTITSCRRSLTELANHHISISSEEGARQQDFAASRSNLILEKSCGLTTEGQVNPRALQPKKQGPPSLGLFLEHHQAICSSSITKFLWSVCTGHRGPAVLQRGLKAPMCHPAPLQPLAMVWDRSWGTSPAPPAAAGRMLGSAGDAAAH